jgi:hypothetical protein
MTISRVKNLAFVPPTPVKTLGDLRKLSDTQLRKESFVGKRLLQTFVGMRPRGIDATRPCAGGHHNPDT